MTKIIAYPHSVVGRPARFQGVVGQADAGNEVMVSLTETTEVQETLLKRAVARCRALRLPLHLIIVSGTLLGVSLGLFTCVAGNYLTVALRQAKDAYVVYRLNGERDELKATNDRLERELASLRAGQAGLEGFQTAMKSRLDELHTIVEGSTALGLFKRKPSTVTQIAKSKKSTGKGTEIAQLLDSPTLTGQRGRERRLSQRESEQQLRDANNALGGAEIECSKNKAGKVVCSSNTAKQDVSFDATTDLRASLAPAVLNSDSASMNGEQEELVERAARYVQILKVLPIGSPVKGKLTSGFGHRLSPFSRRSSFHQGLDVALRNGSHVVAPGDGVVIRAEYDGTYGWMVDIAHTPELVTRYAHLSKVQVRKGHKVKRGQTIALSGSTGRSTGPHLHYEIRYRGRPRNPMPFINLAEKLAKVSPVLLAHVATDDTTVVG